MNQIHAQSPAGASFGWALNQMRDGKQVTRLGWNGKDQYIAILPEKSAAPMTKPFIYIRTVQGDLVPWLASQTDLLAFDWVHA